MSYIIMGKDECGSEFRPAFKNFASEDQAYEHLGEAREQYQEARSLWVEELHDKAYYQSQQQSSYDRDDYDLY
jgi:hypothetical protein